MHYVYRLRSLSDSSHEYTGQTADLRQRLADLNEGSCDSTKVFRPWKIVWYCAFESEEKAISFEKYLKSGSGRAFGKKRLW